MRYFVYILYSATANRYYKGQTMDLTRRLAKHNAGREKSTAPYQPWKLVWYIEKPSRAAAMKLERYLKQLSGERIRQFLLRYPIKE